MAASASAALKPSNSCCIRAWLLSCCRDASLRICSSSVACPAADMGVSKPAELTGGVTGKPCCACKLALSKLGMLDGQLRQTAARHPLEMLNSTLQSVVWEN